MKDLVSILIPVYNRENLISETIYSAINQTYENIEIIISDNASTDGTMEILESFANLDSRIKINVNKTNIGPVKNWEQCINLAKGKFSKILFSDDLISKTFLEDTISHFNNEIAFVITNVVVFDDKGQKSFANFSKTRNIRTDYYLEDTLLYQNYGFPYSPGCALFRTNDLKKALNYNIYQDLNLDFLKYGAGIDLLIFLNIAINYKYIRVNSNDDTYFRSHSESFTISNDLSTYYDFAKFYFVKKFYSKLLNKFYTLLLVRNFLYKKNSPILSFVKGKFSIVFLIYFILNKLYFKITKFLNIMRH